MPTIANPLGAAPVFPEQIPYVETKPRWTDEWNYCDRLVPITASDSVGPSVGQASFELRYGQVVREGMSSFSFIDSRQLMGQFVRVRVAENSRPPQTLWVGIIAEEQIAPDRNDSPSGVETWTAYSLAHALDRDPIDKGRYESPIDSTVKVMDYLPVFNDRSPIERGRRFGGNRSASPSADGVHCFADAEFWSNLDILNYLLFYHSPEGMRIDLAGQADVLATLNKGVHDLGQLTLWQAMDRLIERKRGLLYYLDATNDRLRLVIRTVTDAPIKVGTKVIPPNNDPSYLTLSDSAPVSHLIQSQVRRSETAFHDEVIVYGARPRVCMTLAIAEGQLEADWTQDREDEYKDGAGSDDPAANDRERAADRLSSVYARYALSDQWDGMAIGEKAVLKTKPSGRLVASQDGPFYRIGSTFERDCPLDRDDPTESPSIFKEVDWIPLMGILEDSEDGVEHVASNEYVLLDRFGEGTGIFDGRSIGIKPCDHKLAVEFSVNPRHYIAKGLFDQDNTLVMPELNPENIKVTCSYVGHARPFSKSVINAQPKGIKKRLVVDASKHEFWYVVPGTWVDVEEGVPVEHEGGFVRDRVEELEALSAFAKAWYGRARQGAGIRVSRLGLFVPLGSMLTDIRGPTFREPVRTPITSRSFQFVVGGTSIEADWGDMDVAGGMVEIAQPSSRRNAMARSKPVDEIKANARIAGAIVDWLNRIQPPRPGARGPVNDWP